MGRMGQWLRSSGVTTVDVPLPRIPRALTAALATLTCAGAVTGLTACSAPGGQAASTRPSEVTAAAGVEHGVQRLVPEIIAAYPFDASAFTQGLEVAGDDQLLVGTGQYGQSAVYRVPVGSIGPRTQEQGLEPELFGEGVTRAGDSVWQLTWREGTAIRRNADTLEETGRVPMSGEGWGLCTHESGSSEGGSDAHGSNHGSELLQSDGSSKITRRDPETFAPLGTFEVTEAGQPVKELNELECVGDEVYANVFLTSDIVVFDAATGVVTARIDASALPNRSTGGINAVLNGIAHIPGTDRFYVTGKMWPDLYEVRFVPAS